MASSRRKTEGTKFDFRLQLQASRVPTSGWDKLVVSLLSVETGRITVKTSRGIVRNGSCQWPDPVVESTKLFQNPVTGECNDKLYKLFVQMGSLRAGILGEATINLAEYVTAESPETVSLPLRNCTAGTILHVKIQCLTPKIGLRELEGKRSGSLDQEFPGSVSEDNSSNSDVSETLTTGSVGSSTSQNLAAVSFLPTSQEHYRKGGSSSSALQRDGPPSIATSHYSSDVGDHAHDNSAYEGMANDFANADGSLFGFENHLRLWPNSTTSRDSCNTQESSKTSAAQYQIGVRNLSSPQNLLQTGLTNSNLGLPAKENGLWIAAGLPQKLEAAEATIQEMREETLSWERQARKLSVEVETFRQQLAFELKNGSELKVKISATEAERDSLKSEIKQLKALKVAPKNWDGTDNHSRWEMEDSRRMIKVLQEEVLYEKEVNANLQVQLCKTQDSNVELLTALTELEETLEASNKVVDKVTEANRKLEEELGHTCRTEFSTSKTIDAHVKLKQELDEGQQRLEAAEAILAEKEQKIKWLEFQKGDREITNFLEDSKSHVDNRTRLEAVVAEVDKLALDVADREASMKNLEFLLLEANTEKASLEAKIQDLLEERQLTISQLDAEKTSFLKKLDEAHSESRRKMQRFEEAVEQVESLKTDLDFQLSAKKTLENHMSELFVTNQELEAKIIDLEELNKGLSERVSSLEMQLTNMFKDQDQYVEIASAERLDYERQISGLQSDQTRLVQELKVATSECSTMQEKFAAVETKMMQQQHESGKNEQILRAEIEYLLGCKKNFEQCANEAEKALIAAQREKDATVHLLQTELEHLSLVVDEKEKLAMAEIAELHAEKLELESSLGLMKEKVKELDNVLLLHKTLDVRVEDLSLELDASKNLCNDLTQKLQEKESVLQEQLENQKKQENEFQRRVRSLEEEILQRGDAFSRTEKKLMVSEDDERSKENLKITDSQHVLELQKRLRQLKDEASASKEQLVICRREFLQKEIELVGKIEHLELSNEQLAAGLTDSGAEQQLKQELIRLQNQNSFLSRKEQELLSRMHTQEVLQEEVKRLQEANDLLEARLSKFVETAKNPSLPEKIISLETELAEAVEANNMYKLQLKSVFDKQQNISMAALHELGDLNHVVEDLFQYKKKATQLEGELDSMHKRYAFISLQLAEAEAERGELMITVKNLKGVKKT